MIKYEEKRFRLTGISPLLGSSPMNKQIFTDYIATKGKTTEEKARGKDDAEDIVDSNDKVTGFYRDRETGNIILKPYQIKGFLKEAAKSLKDSIGLASTTSKIDNLVFIMDKVIPVTRNGQPITAPDDYLERPLRGETAQGPRVSLAKSEMIEEGWQVEFTARVLSNKGSAKSVPLTMEVFEQFLEYGELKGLLQWRNGGYGSFTFEEI